MRKEWKHDIRSCSQVCEYYEILAGDFLCRCVGFLFSKAGLPNLDDAGGKQKRTSICGLLFSDFSENALLGGF